MLQVSWALVSDAQLTIMTKVTNNQLKKINTMKKLITVLALVFFMTSLKAQIEDPSFENYQKTTEVDFKKYSDSVSQEFLGFRQKANEEYAQFMREQWKAFAAMQEEQRPTIPEPPRPFERDKNTPIPDLPIRIPVQPILIPEPSPIIPIKLPDTPTPSPFPVVKEFSFLCYGTPCTVRVSNGLKFKLDNNSENSVADAWEQLSSETNEILLEDCLRLRKELSLGDWAYYCLLRDLGDSYFGNNTDESKIIQAYLLAQSGFDFRIARQNEHLVLLIPFDSDILSWEKSPQYVTRYIPIDGRKYYIVSKSVGGSTHVFNHKFCDNNRVFSLRMSCPPKFAYKSTEIKTFASARYPELNVKLATNKNLIDFYNEYPSCYWDNYAWAGLSDDVKSKLYPVLRSNIKGKSQIEAANRLINFVQTAFEYKTDGGQFGYERSLFGDETFYYPFSDCEDRSILFSILVRDLLGLDVVLLHYHDHLATAVHYTEKLCGYYFTLDGKDYYISDPTYIGANVGECMPGYETESPEIFKL